VEIDKGLHGSLHSDELLTFRKTYSKKQYHRSGLDWEYIVAGSGREVVCMIHGGSGSAESIFRYTTALEKNYRVITPTIPTDISNVRAALDGIEAILVAENAMNVHCIGFSMGGMLEQVFLREHMDWVKTITLFHCPPPSKAFAKSMQRAVRINRIMPVCLWRTISSYALSREFRKYPNVPKEEKAFWTQYYSGVFSKERIINQLRIVVDYLKNYHFTANDLDKWPGKVLIFETATDTLIPYVERQRLKELYPHARVHTFMSGTHLGNGIFLFDVTKSVIEDFLATVPR